MTDTVTEVRLMSQDGTVFVVSRKYVMNMQTVQAALEGFYFIFFAVF